MNTFKKTSGPLTWLAALLLTSSLAACGGGGGGGSTASTGLTAAVGVTVVPGLAGAPGGTATDPTVTAAIPANGAINVATSSNSSANVVSGTNVTATFSQAMNPATIVSTPAGTLLTFTLKQTVSGANVPGTVSMNAANTAATFTPSATALATSTAYTATITMAATNASGTAMANPVAWSFTTKATASTAQAPVDLGLAGNYAIFAKTGIDNAVAPAAVTGNMGVGPGVTSTAITGPWALNLPAGGAFSTSTQVTGNIYAFDYAAPTPTAVTTASVNMGTAYTDAAGRLLPDSLDLSGGNLAGLTLAPGLYKWGSNVTLPFGTNVTISGGPDDVWIFQISGTLTTAAATQVILAGGAKAKNIYWQVAGTSVTFGANAQFHGIVLAQNAINVGNQAALTSRLLAQTAVNLSQNAVVQPAQ
jgi:hypothetical protein